QNKMYGIFSLIDDLRHMQYFSRDTVDPQLFLQLPLQGRLQLFPELQVTPRQRMDNSPPDRYILRSESGDHER
ncbi:MAG: hypothetical protein LRY55_06945, partial [Leadbetterella sp.]|nr:hypothetical protein [Leadbetterella sp.]